jgi:putative Mn2+ efflux pump MntP
MIGSMVAFALPLGTDSAAVCTAYAAQEGRVRMRRRLAIVGVLTGFEALMPGVGMLMSGPVAGAIGSTANYIAAILLVGLGLVMLFKDEDGPELGAGALLAVGLAVSIDEVAVGVSLGLHGVPFIPLALTIGVWVAAATMLGLTLGERVPEKFHQIASVVAAVALIGLGVLIGCGVL